MPGDLKVVAEALDGSPFAGFMVDAVLGPSSAHPRMPFEELMTDQGKKTLKKARSHCLLGTISTLAGQKIEDNTEDRLSLEQLYALKGPDGRTWGTTEDATRKAHCEANITTRWKMYPGEHQTTDQLAKDDTVKWLGERFDGKPEFGNCPLP